VDGGYTQKNKKYTKTEIKIETILQNSKRERI
jgi:hypothetical protein